MCPYRHFVVFGADQSSGPGTCSIPELGSERIRLTEGVMIGYDSYSAPYRRRATGEESRHALLDIQRTRRDRESRLVSAFARSMGLSGVRVP
jgi:hypothetical protein